MGIEIVIIIVAVAFISGVILTLRYIGGRPINVNVSSHAEAHGGSATASPGNSASESGSSMLGALKFLVVVALVGMCALLAASTLGKLAEPVKVTVDVPKQEPPVVNIPQADPPTINVTPQVPMASPALETVALLVGMTASVSVLVVSLFVLRKLRARDRNIEAGIQYPIEYVRTSYGWTPKRVDSDAIPADQVAPGLFKHN